MTCTNQHPEWRDHPDCECVGCRPDFHFIEPLLQRTVDKDAVRKHLVELAAQARAEILGGTY